LTLKKKKNSSILKFPFLKSSSKQSVSASLLPSILGGLRRWRIGEVVVVVVCTFKKVLKIKLN
jgi:hypothetical protein